MKTSTRTVRLFVGDKEVLGLTAAGGDPLGPCEEADPPAWAFDGNLPPPVSFSVEGGITPEGRELLLKAWRSGALPECPPGEPTHSPRCGLPFCQPCWWCEDLQRE